MRIKQIRLKGFKSFAEKTTIDFDDNFIGVVGPNGSGKSNVIDAIKWVFGEHSNKTLRGNSSTDIIFGGTEKRAKHNIAEVSIVLDNSDRHLNIEYDEVSITRRIYRTGNSEYFINKNECRLKDVIDLTLDKGIGKNAFSIISQGKIEEIIMVSPENRRVVVEEVAGILKYKKRKENTLKKLGKTDENIKQVNLILQEMDERKGPLEKQAKTAIKFKEYKEELSAKEISLLANKITDSKNEYEALKEINQNQKLKVIELESTEMKLEESNNNLSHETHNISVEINSKNSKLIQLNQKLNEKKSDYKILQERKQFIEKKSERVIYLENTITHIEDEINKIQSKINDLTPRYENYVQRHENLIQRLNTSKSIYNKNNQKINDLEGELSRHVVPFAARKILESKLDKVNDLVINSFTTNVEYAEAIAVSIGGRINDIIVEDKNSAQKAINYLKEHRFGRQTFLPKDIIKPMYIDETTRQKLDQINGFIGVAQDLVNYDETNKKIFANLLGNIIVVTNMKVALEISKDVTNRYRIVTLDGDILATSGSMSGGKTQKRNKLVIENELNQLIVENEKLSLVISNVNEENISNEEKKIEIKSEISLNEALVNKQKNEKLLLVTELNNLNGDEIGSEDFSVLSQEVETLGKEIELVNKEKTLLEIKYQNELENLEESRHHQREINEQIKIENNELKKNEIITSKLEVEIKNALEILTQDYQMSITEAEQKAEKNIDIESYEKIVRELKGKIRNLGPVNILAIDEYEQINTRYEFIDEQKTDLLQAKEKLEDIINKLDIFFIESFEETYVKLRQEFQNIFAELFGGGRADLVLTKPDDLLETGVEIVAQPPGKKLQTISLLSGGEKALTAISLLFAILRIKKLPFAILDEVEAALDEVNVKRYAKYIKIFSERTQFIVITHRQGTMETVDSLYGVTMQEKGISKIVKVKINEGANYVQ